MRYKLILYSLISLSVSCTEQNVFFDLRENSQYDSLFYSPKSTQVLDSTGKLNYVNTLIYTYKLTKGNVYNDCITCKPGDTEKSVFANALSFVGDNENAINYSGKVAGGPPFISDSLNIKGIVLLEAKKNILNVFKNSSVMMFNEAHDRVQTRTFLLSLLGDLKKEGAEVLALETLKENGNLKTLDNTTGFYTAEPICGQIIREALKLGYRLVSYEDTINNSNAREQNQAKNLLKQITKNGKVDKTIVLGGYDHISENSVDTLFKSMASYFKSYSGINPVTVNQTTLIESPIDPVLRVVLERAVRTKISEIKSVSSEVIKSIYATLSENEIPNYPYYDIYIYFPATEYIHKRPNWLLILEDREFVSIEIPKNLKPVLIQAYLSKEIRKDEDFNFRIPFDQTFMSENGKAWLVLKKREVYSIVFRDEYNFILLKKEIKR